MVFNECDNLLVTRPSDSSIVTSALRVRAILYPTKMWENTEELMTRHKEELPEHMKSARYLYALSPAGHRMTTPDLLHLISDSTISGSVYDAFRSANKDQCVALTRSIIVSYLEGHGDTQTDVTVTVYDFPVEDSPFTKVTVMTLHDCGETNCLVSLG